MKLAMGNYYQNAEFLDAQNLYNFDEWDLLETTLEPTPENTPKNGSEETEINPDYTPTPTTPTDPQNGSEPFYGYEPDHTDEPITPPAPRSWKLRKPHERKERNSDASARVNKTSTYLDDIHLLSEADRNDLELLDREIARLTKWINFVEAEYPPQKTIVGCTTRAGCTCVKVTTTTP